MDKRVEAAAKAIRDNRHLAPLPNGRRLAIAILTAADAAAPQAGGAVPAGYKLVPVEPTQEMVDAGDDTSPMPLHSDWNSRDVWEAMLAATPPTPAQPANSAVREVTDALPEWSDICRKEDVGEELTAVEILLLDNEPADPADAEKFREQVRAALASLGAGGGV